jgi:hypothetical protein
MSKVKLYKKKQIGLVRGYHNGMKKLINDVMFPVGLYYSNVIQDNGASRGTLNIKTCVCIVNIFNKLRILYV